MSEEIFKFIGKIIAVGGGAAAVAYGLFLFLGKSWIESKYSQRLEHLRSDINSIYSRVTKIHQKEFEVLPVMWGKLHAALGAVHAFVSPLKEYPDIKKMSEGELKWFIEKIGMPEHKVKEFMIAGDRQRYYEDYKYEEDYLRAMDAIRDFHNDIIMNRLFLDDDIKGIVLDIDVVLRNVAIDYKYSYELRDWKSMHKASRAVGEDVENKVFEVEKLVQKRLRFGEA